MTLPGAPVLASDSSAATVSTQADPFGLWQPPSAAAGDALSFALPAEGAPGADAGAPSAVWRLALSSDRQGRAPGGRELERLSARVQSIEAGLDASDQRVDAFLSARSRSLESSGVSFSSAAVVTLPPPEAGLSAALSVLDPSGAPGPISFGLPPGLPSSVDWEALYQRLSALLDSVNRQILHFAWVDTTLDNRLIARSTVNWGGDLVTCWQPGLSQDLTNAHCRSLALAMASRLANLRAVLTVSQIAGKIALALTTPLGPIQALSLAWQFISSVVSSQAGDLQEHSPLPVG